MSGGRKPRYSDADILSSFVNSDDPVLTTSEVQDEFGYSTTSGARKRLEGLENAGYINSKAAGPAQVWWITDEGIKQLTDE